MPDSTFQDCTFVINFHMGGSIFVFKINKKAHLTSIFLEHISSLALQDIGKFVVLIFRYTETTDILQFKGTFTRICHGQYLHNSLVHSTH